MSDESIYWSAPDSINKDVYSSSPKDRQREQQDAQIAYDERSKRTKSSGQNEEESPVTVGEQQLEEQMRTLSALMEDIENRGLQLDPKVLLHMQQIMEKNVERLRRLKTHESLDPATPEPGALERFVQFSEEFVLRHHERVKEIHEKEAQYRDGDLTEEEYREVSAERQKFMSEFEDGIYELAGPLHISQLREIASDDSRDQHDPERIEAKRSLHAFDLAHAYLIEEVGPMIQLEPEQRLMLFWGRLEKYSLPFKSAYDQLLSVYELRQAAYHLGKAEMSDVKKALDDLNAAWEEKRDAFERLKMQFSHKRGFSDDEKMELEERARIVLQPEAPVPMSFESEQTRPLKRPELPPLEITKHDENEKPILELKRQVLQWQDIATTLEGAGKLTPDVCTELLGELSNYEEKLDGIDTQGDLSGAAKERAALEALIGEMRAKLEFNRDFYIATPQDDEPLAKPVAKPVSATDARSAYHEVVAAYTAVQHALSVDERRDIRTRIARMASLVRQAEVSHAVTHATEHAPAIAHATLASMPTLPRRYEVRTISLPHLQPQMPIAKSSRGILGALSDAFRLK